MFRAAWTIARGGEVQGGSTITQQYIKILYLNSEQTLTRKFSELFLAYKINKEMTKEEILEGYLNTIYFGRGAYGIAGGEPGLLRRSTPSSSTAQQAAFLTTVINNPSLFDPARRARTLAATPGALPLRARVHGRDRRRSPRPRPPATAEQLPEFPEVETNERYGGPKGFLLKMVERELSRRRLRRVPDQRRRAQDHHHLRQAGAERRGRGRPELHQAGRRRGDQKARNLHAASPRSTSAPARCWPSTAVPTSSRTPATGPPRRARPPPPSRRTPWPPA